MNGEHRVKTPQSSAWLVLNLLLGLGLFAWVYIARQQKDYDGAGFSLAEAPAAQDSVQQAVFSTEPSAQDPAAWLASRPAASVPTQPQTAAAPDSLPIAEELDPQYVDALGPQAPPPSEAARTDAVPGPTSLTQEESSALSRAMGGWNDASASRLGGDVPLLVKAVETMFGYPRIAKHVLDNDMVIKGYLNGPGKALCSSPQALADFLADTSNPTGVRMFLGSYRDNRGRPGAVDAVLGSKMGKTLTGCPSVPALYQDPKMVTQVIQGNPQLLWLLADPPMIQGLTKAPHVLDAVSSFKLAYWKTSEDR